MGVDHCRFDILVAEEFVGRSDVMTLFQKVGREAVTERVGTDRLDDAGQTGRLFDRLLQAALVQVVATSDAGTWILG